MAVTKIGRYEIERELGRGGMGVVYLARDPAMKRQVAIKVLPRQFTFDDQFRKRFQREAEIIATLEHPYIVPIYDIGEESEQPYLVVRYMPGGTLLERLTARTMDLSRLTRIISRVAEALDEAHLRHIIHRDLKPANILFDAREEAYLSDFGIAKVSESGAFTGTGVLGTPEYMSPEQARGLKELDGRSDIYSLGVVIFEALTARLPYEADTPMGAAVAHITEPVPSILKIRPDLPPACEAIIQWAMAKNPNDRYATAGELAQALKKVVETPDAALSEVDRRRLAPTAVPTAQVTPPPTIDPRLITAQSAAKVTQLHVLRGHKGMIWHVTFNPDGGMVASVSNDHTVQVWLASVGMLARAFEGHTDVLWGAAFSPDGRWLASGGRDKTICLWEVASGQLVRTLQQSNGVTSLAFSPDGKWLASGSHDSTINLWDTTTGKLIRTLRGHTSRVSGVAFAPDGTLLISGALDGTVRVWNVKNVFGPPHPNLEGHAASVWGVAVSRDGRYVAGGADKTVRVWDLATGRLLVTGEGHENTVSSVAFSPDGQLLLSGGNDEKMCLWEMQTGQLLHMWHKHAAEVNSVAFSPDGHLLASGSVDGTVRVWSVAQT